MSTRHFDRIWTVIALTELLAGIEGAPKPEQRPCVYCAGTVSARGLDLGAEGMAHKKCHHEAGR